jgi:hypothetical protein
MNPYEAEHKEPIKLVVKRCKTLKNFHNFRFYIEFPGLHYSFPVRIGHDIINLNKMMRDHNQAGIYSYYCYKFLFHCNNYRNF